MILVVFVFIVGCGGKYGAEGQRCYPDGTCESNLTCINNHCENLSDKTDEDMTDQNFDNDNFADDLIDENNSVYDDSIYETEDDKTVFDRCGNGRLDPEEICETRNTTSCDSLNFDYGTATCKPDCSGWDTSECKNNECGDGRIDEGEVCEIGDINSDCISLGFDYGEAYCNSSCTGWDTSTCKSDICGDGKINDGEICEIGDINSDCISLGFDSGVAYCNSSCTGWNTSTCKNDICGDGKIDAHLNEICDKGYTKSCSSLGKDYDSGTAECNNTCDGWDTSTCSPVNVTIVVSDLCDDGSNIKYRFFGSDGVVWPGTSTYFTTSGYYKIRTHYLTCKTGSKIYFGGTNVDYSWDCWGIGVNGNEMCSSQNPKICKEGLSDGWKLTCN